MLERLRSLRRRNRDRDASRDPIIGFALKFKNAEIGAQYEGWPHEILSSMKSDGRDLMALAEHLATEIVTSELHGMPALEFSGPLTEFVLDLMAAFEERDFEQATRILAEHPEILAGDEEQAGFPLLSSACAAEADVVAFLLVNGARVDAVDDLGMSALHWSAAYGHEEVVSRLLEHGADPEEHSILLVTPADLAHLNGHAALSERLAAGQRVSDPLGFAVIRRMDSVIERT